MDTLMNVLNLEASSKLLFIKQVHTSTQYSTGDSADTPTERVDCQK